MKIIRNSFMTVSRRQNPLPNLMPKEEKRRKRDDKHHWAHRPYPLPLRPRPQPDTFWPFVVGPPAEVLPAPAFPSPPARHMDAESPPKREHGVPVSDNGVGNFESSSALATTSISPVSTPMLTPTLPSTDAPPSTRGRLQSPRPPSSSGVNVILGWGEWPWLRWTKDRCVKHGPG